MYFGYRNNKFMNQATVFLTLNNRMEQEALKLLDRLSDKVKRSAQMQYNYNTTTITTQKIVVLQQSAQAQYNCNTSFLQLVQVACKFSASCRKLVLQRCNVM